MSPTLIQPYLLDSSGKFVKAVGASPTASTTTTTTTTTTTSSSIPAAVRSYIKVAEKPQKSYATVADMVADNSYLPGTSSANYVMWNSAWGTDLATAFAATGANDILVLPEQSSKYLIDLSGGFSAPSGTQSVEGWPSALRTASNTWFTGARGGRGLVGLGPGAVVGYKSGSWTAPAQPKSWGYVDSSGTRQAFSSAECTAIQFSAADGYIGNFAVDAAPDLGGIAYGFVGMTKSSGKSTAFRLSTQGGWYGFAGDPNGEIGFLNFNNASINVLDCYVDCNKPDGTKSGVSPIMGNSITGGGTVTRCFFANSWQGMPTFWNCGGTFTFTDFVSYNNYGYGINLEKSRSGVEYDFIRGYLDVGSKTSSPRMHIGIGDYQADAKVVLTDTGIASNGYWANQLSCQDYGDGSGTHTQVASDVTYTLNGVAQTVHVAS